ncbi:transposase [Pararhizobium sp. LjRoot255]
MQPGTNISAVARRIGIDPSQLFTWLRHAGMPVEVFIQTGERTALSYLVKPLADQIARAMREE